MRYDKRTLTHNSTLLKDIPNFNIDNEYTEEVAAAIEFVSNKYKGRKLYFLGHSMGAFMAPRNDEGKFSIRCCYNDGGKL